MSEKTRLENGQETLAQVDGEAAANVMHSLADIAPDVGKYILEFAFSDIYNRPGLDLKQREMITAYPRRYRRPTTGSSQWCTQCRSD